MNKLIALISLSLYIFFSAAISSSAGGNSDENILRKNKSCPSFSTLLNEGHSDTEEEARAWVRAVKRDCPSLFSDQEILTSDELDLDDDSTGTEDDGTGAESDFADRSELSDIEDDGDRFPNDYGYAHAYADADTYSEALTDHLSDEDVWPEVGSSSDEEIKTALRENCTRVDGGISSDEKSYYQKGPVYQKRPVYRW